LAIFSWRKSDSGDTKPSGGDGTQPSGPSNVPAAAGGGAGGGTGPVDFSPQKAEKFFQHARTMYESSNYEYAVQLWLNGLRWDPNSRIGIEGFFSSMARFTDDAAGKKTLSKDTIKNVSGKSDVDKYVMSLLDWGLRPTDSFLAVRAAESSAKLGLQEPTLWITERAFGLALRDKKIRKDLLLRCSECFAKANVFEKALIAAEQALKADPTDGELAAKIRSLAAQATMTKGGYERTGQEGGFRANIRDADKQRQLEEEERIVKTDETVDRLILHAAEEVAKRPGDLPTIERYGKLLMERARPSDEERAYQLYMQTYTDTRQFRFRELAGEIRIRQSRRKVSELRIMLEKSPDGEMIQRMFSQAEQEHNRLELGEYKLRVDNYPSDLARRFELGKRYFAVGQYHEAIEQFQESQQEPRNRAASMMMLGQSFQKIAWNEEAIDTFRHAADLKDLLPDTYMEIRYFLMTALQAKADTERDIPSAEEADRLASSIARQQMSYKDIRVRREAIKNLLIKLRGPRSTDPGTDPAPA